MALSKIIDTSFKLFQDRLGQLKAPKGIADILGEYSKAYGDEIFPHESTLEDLTLDSVKQSVRKGYSLQRERELSDVLGKVVKDAEANKLDVNHNTFEFFNTRIKTTSGALEEEHKAFVGRLETEIANTGGREAYNIFQLGFSNPKSLKKNFGISNEDVFLALADPNLASNPILRTIGTAYRKLDSNFASRIKNISVMGELDDYVVPLSPNPNVVESLGRKGFTEVLTRYTKMSPERAESIAEGYFDQLASKGPDKTKIKFHSRDLVFDQGEKGLRDQYQFYKIVSGLNDDNAGILERVVYHKEKTLQKAYFFREFGESPVETINKIYQKAKEGAGEEKLKKLSEYQKKNLKDSGVRNGAWLRRVRICQVLC